MDFLKSLTVFQLTVLGIAPLVLVAVVYSHKIFQVRKNPGFDCDDVDYSCATGSFDIGAHQRNLRGRAPHESTADTDDNKAA